MAFKFIAIIALASVAVAGPIEYQGYNAGPALIKSYAAPAVVKTVAAPVYKSVEYQHEAPAEYDFSYAVHDEHTGDIKSQQESRKGDVVHGRYELIESDGHRRIVEYTADAHSGFNAVVHREPTDYKIPQYQKVIAAPVTKLAYAAPVAKVAYSAPVTKVAYTAPVTKVAYATAPAHYAAPAAHYAAPAAHYAAAGHDAAHVSFNGPSLNYHY